MDRRKILGLGLAALVTGAIPAFAESFADSVISQLKRRGFKRITVGRTFLGRTRIVALGNGGRREIILNPRTGEILRDLWTTSNSVSEGGSSGGLLSNGGTASRDDKDQDDDDRDDDRGDDDDGDKSSGGDDDGDDDD